MRENILTYLQSEPYKKASIEELRDVLHVSSSDDIKSFMKALNQLIDEAVVIENNQHEVTLIEHTNYVVGTLDLKPRGFGFVVPTDPSLNDVFIPKPLINDAMNKDLVLVHVSPFGYGARQEGEIKRVLERRYTHIIGEVLFRKKRAIILCDDKTIQSDVVVARDKLHGAKQHDKVRATITNYSNKGNIEVEITDVFGNKNDKGVDLLSKIIKHNVDPIFHPSVIQEAAQYTTVTKDDLKNRKDLRKEPYITIDGDDAKDFDDAVLVKQLDNGHYLLGVSIADVSYYVQEDSILDKEAYKRGTSVYLPGTVIPMLPENLSNHICSLKPHEDRLTITCEMEIDTSGKVVKYDIFPSVIHSHARMTYNNVNKIYMGDVPLAEEYVHLVGIFYDMRNLAKVLKKHRESFGSINFETEEPYFTLDENGRAIDVKLRERGVSESIIEEFMLLANQTVAEHMHWLDLPFIYRVHDKPTEEKLGKLLDMAHALDIRVKGKKEISHFELQKLLDAVHGTDAEYGINLLMLRSMQKAIYSEQNVGHYGLSFKYYTHFTSPIRRYPDLIVHRLLRAFIFDKNNVQKRIDHYDGIMKEVAAKSSENERRAVLLERDVMDMKKAEYISQYIGSQFDGIISSVTNFGLYISLPNTVEGLVHISTLSDDYYKYVDHLLLLYGEHTGKTYRVGDRVTIEVIGANIIDGEVDFRIVKRTDDR